MIKTKNIVISLIILGVASLSLIDEDTSIFLLSGQSNTYAFSLIRYSPIVVFSVSFVVMFGVFLFRKGTLYKYLLGISLVLWVLSNRTYAIANDHDTIVISGFAIIPVDKHSLSPKDNYNVIFDFFIAREVEKTIQATRLNR